MTHRAAWMRDWRRAVISFTAAWMRSGGALGLMEAQAATASKAKPQPTRDAGENDLSLV